MPPVICIVGKNKKNKSRLIEVLIKELKDRGIKVGALKHHKHGDFEIDIQGKDSWKYSKSGADTVAISSPTKFSMIRNVDEEMDIQQISDIYFSDNDIILADGFTLSDKPRIIVADDPGDKDIFKNKSRVVAIVGEIGIRIDDFSAIADSIETFLESVKNN